MGQLNRYLIATLLVAVAFLYFFTRDLQRRLDNQRDVAGYYKTMSDGVSKVYKDKDSLWRIQTSAILISNNALKKVLNDHTSQLYDLSQEFGQKAKNTISTNTTTIQNETRFNVKIKDTIINHMDTVMQIKYSDKFLSIDGVIKHDTLSGEISYRDSLDQIVYKERTKIVGLKIGKLSYKSELRSKNPNTKITSNSFMLIRK